MGREHPFGTTADCPAGPVIGEFANLRAGDIKKAYLCVSLRRATLHIEQDIRRDEIAAAGRQSIKPVRAAVGAAQERDGRNRHVFAQACRAYCESQRPTRSIGNRSRSDRHQQHRYYLLRQFRRWQRCQLRHSPRRRRRCRRRNSRSKDMLGPAAVRMLELEAGLFSLVPAFAED